MKQYYYVVYKNSPRCKGCDVYLDTQCKITGDKNKAQGFADVEMARLAAKRVPDSNDPGHEPAEVMIGVPVLHFRSIRPGDLDGN